PVAAKALGGKIIRHAIACNAGKIGFDFGMIAADTAQLQDKSIATMGAAPQLAAMAPLFQDAQVGARWHLQRFGSQHSIAAPARHRPVPGQLGGWSTWSFTPPATDARRRRWARSGSVPRPENPAAHTG